MQGLFYCNNLKMPRQMSIMPDILFVCLIFFVSFVFAIFAPKLTVAKCIKAKTNGIHSCEYPKRQSERLAMPASSPTAKPSATYCLKQSLSGVFSCFLTKFAMPVMTKNNEPAKLNTRLCFCCIRVVSKVVSKHNKRVATATTKAKNHVFLVFKPTAKPATILSMLTAKAVSIKKTKKSIITPSVYSMTRSGYVLIIGECFCQTIDKRLYKL